MRVFETNSLRHPGQCRMKNESTDFVVGLSRWAAGTGSLDHGQSLSCILPAQVFAEFVHNQRLYREKAGDFIRLVDQSHAPKMMRGHTLIQVEVVHP